MHDVDGELPQHSPRWCLPTQGDPRVPLILTVAAILAVVTSTSLVFGVTTLACSVIVRTWLRIPVTETLHQLIGPALLAVLVLLAKTFLTGATPLAELELGGYRATATREGLAAGVLIGTRILAAFSVLTLLCRGASMHEWAAALRWARVPHGWIEIALLMHRYLHLFASQAVGVVCAQRVRLGYRSPRRGLASVGIAAGMILLRSLDQAQRSHQAMIARAYRGLFPLPPLPPLSKSQAIAACAGVAVIVAVLAIAERYCP